MILKVLYILTSFLTLAVLVNVFLYFAQKRKKTGVCPICGIILDPDWNRCPNCLTQDKPVESVGWLIINSGINFGKEFKILYDTIIGNSIDSKIVIPYRIKNTRLAIIEVNDEKFYIRKLDTACNMIINNRDGDKFELLDGDKIDIAGMKFTFKKV